MCLFSDCCLAAALKIVSESVFDPNFFFLLLYTYRFNEFDHRFFGINDSEVEQMDPQQKQLLQCVYRALENAGIPMEEASGTRTGVFFGKFVKMG